MDSIVIGGQNLIKGTRKFIKDDERAKGFKIPSSNMIISTDDNGFGVIDVSATGRTSNIIDSAYSSFVDFELIKNKDIVISFDFMVDDVEAWD